MSSPSPNKRRKYGDDKHNNPTKSNAAAVKTDNFARAINLVSQNAYFNHIERLQLLYLPCCNTCDSQNKFNIKPMPTKLLSNLKEDLNVHLWHECLETCFLSITPKQYLPAYVLGEIVEIILNVHEDIVSNHTAEEIVKKCQQVLAYNFNMHPPCHQHREIMYCYKNFLCDPMALRRKTYTNRDNYNYTNGILQYCFNRLEDELSKSSQDGPLFSKEREIFRKDAEDDDKIYTLKFLYLQQQKFEVFEMLPRIERIDRLMAVLYSILELIQFDVYFSRRNENTPLLERFWEKHVQNPPFVKQIIKIFAYFIHLGYPEHHIQTMSLWLNTLIETFYDCGANNKLDYPLPVNRTNYMGIVIESIISDLPQQSIVKILEKIEPPYMRHLVSEMYCAKICKGVSEEDKASVINVIEKIIKTKRNEFKNEDVNLVPKNIRRNIRTDEILNHLSSICKDISYWSCTETESYGKFNVNVLNVNNLNTITKPNVHTLKVLSITLHALLDAYHIRKVHDVITNQGQELNQNSYLQSSAYKTSEKFEEMCRSIYDAQMNLNKLLQNLRKKNDLPKIFECYYM